MKKQVAGLLDNAITLLLLLVAGLTPLFFLNQTTEFYEIPKLVFLVVATTVILGLWILSWIFKEKVEITRTPLDFPLLALLVVVLLSTYFSASRFPAIYGNFPRVHGSAVAWITYILLYFVTVSNLKNMSQVKAFLYVLYGSAVVTALVSLLSFFHVYMPFDFAQAVNFTPTGSTFSTLAFLMLLLPLSMVSIVKPNKYLPLPFALVVSILFSVVIALIGSVPMYVVLAIVFVLCFLIARPHKASEFKKVVPLFLAPIIVAALVLVAAYVPFTGNKLQQLEGAFPREIQLPFATSWKVSATAFRDAPYLGTGPASYLFDFTSYKPLEFNNLDFWNFSFDSAYNEFLQILGTLGILGILSFVGLCLVALNNSRMNFMANNSESEHDDTHVLLPGLAISALVAVILLSIHATTLISIVVTFFIFAALMASQKSIREKVMHLSMGIKASTLDNQSFDLLPVIIFILFVIGAGFVLFKTSNAVAADYYHRQALLQANKSGNKTYGFLQKAEALNPVIDLYRVDMAQTNFALANAIAIQKGPSTANPKGNLTDDDKRTIQTLISQSINEGRVAVALSPLSSRNWEVLASLYRNISGIAQNSLTFSLDAYGRAIQRDPLNPSLRLSVGGLYYSIKNYDLAIRFFTDAANLKPDNANSYYNLAIALRDKGDLPNAKLVIQQAISILSKTPNSADYKVASNVLSDINTKIASNNKNTTNETTNAPTTNLPAVNVNELNNPPKVATPAAIKQNPNTNLPNLTVTPSAAPTQ